MTEAEINVVMGDGMADVEMEAIAIGMDEEATGVAEEKEKAVAAHHVEWIQRVMTHSHHYKGWDC